MMAGFGLIWIIILAAAVYLIVVLVRKSAGGSAPNDPSEPGDRAEAFLRERFARGEIDRDEFEDRLQELRR